MEMTIRPRRLRSCDNLRRMVRETRVSPDSLIYPLFLIEGENIREPIPSLDGQWRYSPDRVCEEIEECMAAGVKRVLLFGIPARKDACGSSAWDPNGVVQQGIRAIKEKYPDCYVITDVCMCEYTDHGHCGILAESSVNNDATLEISAKQALIHAKNGADMIAPSGMMDGIIACLREALDKGGFENLPVMAYSTKFASAYYGPFRDVAQSAPSFGDRKSYQMDSANRFEAIRESLEDEAQGADILMVKPALAFLDIIRDIKERSLLPLCAYNVSGEYALLKAGAKLGVIDYEKVMMETLLGIKRAGADMIISYHAKEVAKIL